MKTPTFKEAVIIVTLATVYTIVRKVKNAIRWIMGEPIVEKKSYKDFKEEINNGQKNRS